MTRDEIIAAAREVNAHVYTNRFQLDAPSFAFDIERLEKFVELVRPRWIPVAERLPEQDGLEIIVYVPGAAVSQRWPAKWDAENRRFAAGAGWFEQDEVTHWMPAPTAPDIEGGA